MTIVIDSSIAASWGIPDEASPAALKSLSIAMNADVLVPSHFWQELRNVFLVNERRGRLTPQLTHTGIAMVSGLVPIIDNEGDHATVLDVARRHDLTAYDAAFLELALRRRATLATLDKQLARAGLREGMDVVADLA